MMKTTSIMKMHEDEDEEIPESPTFHTDVADILQVGEIALIIADDPVHFIYLLYITKKQESIIK